MGDLALIYAWRNRPEVRAFMYTSSEISREEHGLWFSSILKDTTRRLLILSFKDVECAVISFSNIDSNQACSWGFYSGPGAPAGVSSLIELVSLEYAFENLQMRRVHCEVLSGNQQVVNLHRKAGFIQEGCLRKARQTPRGVENVFIFGMLRDEWPAARDRLRDRAAKLFTTK